MPSRAARLTRATNLFLLLALCLVPLGGRSTYSRASSRAQETPAIIFTSVPPFGSTSENLLGRVLNANPSDFRVAVFINVPDLGWFTKPFCSPSLTTIQSDGTFNTDVVTGGVDQTATHYSAYLVPASFSHPCVLGAGAVPATVEQQALAKATVRRSNPAEKTIRFSGYDWFVKTNVGRVFPGPNLFSDRSENVSVDQQGRLHLRITNRDGRWFAAEVFSERTFGLGTYRFHLDGPVDDLDQNIVFGLFTFGMDPSFGHREIDIEFSRFGNASAMNAQYVIQPFNVSGNIRRFQMPPGVGASVHSFDWRADRIDFRSHRGAHTGTPDDASLIHQWTYTQTIPNTFDEKARLNLWLFNDVPPSNGMEREVVVKKFEFIPASSDTTPPGLTNARVDPAALQTWGGTVPLSVEIADNVGVTSAWAEVTRPDRAVERIELTRTAGTALGGVWAGAYRAHATNKAFQVTFFARDQAQNQGRSELVNFALQPGVSIFHFGSPNFVGSETDRKADIVVLRSGDLSNAAAVDYATSDGTALERSDYSTALGTLRFGSGEASKTFTVFLTDDGHVEADETLNLALTNAAGTAIIGAPSSASLVINDNDPAPPALNPIDETQFFVRQHYVDFLGREPDAAGLNFWADEITSCGADAQCREVKRVNVSAAFFLSIEFQETGFLAYRLYKTAYGDATSPGVPGTVPVIRFKEFLQDAQQIGQGVRVGIGDWEQQLEANKNSLALEFVGRQRFTAAYPLSMTPAQFVGKLNTQAGGVLSQVEHDQLVGELTASGNTAQGRAGVLRKVAEDADLRRAEFNRAFVLMQYYGYLRRNPDDPQDTDFRGWKFWLDKLNQFNGNFVDAEMVRAFIQSIEYRQRFGQ